MKKMECFKRERTSNDCSMLVSDIFAEWSLSAQFRIKESTRANYLLKWNKHIFPVFGNRAVSTIKISDIYEFIAMKQSSGLSDRYISDIIVLLLCFYG